MSICQSQSSQVRQAMHPVAPINTVLDRELPGKEMASEKGCSVRVVARSFPAVLRVLFPTCVLDRHMQCLSIYLRTHNVCTHAHTPTITVRIYLQHMYMYTYHIRTCILAMSVHAHIQCPFLHTHNICAYIQKNVRGYAAANLR
jgi:hypothetical protein